MKAAVVHELNAPFVIEDVALEEPGPGEVRVRMAASGVCHSDWHVLTGAFPRRPMPVVLGHEGAGVVEATGRGVAHVEPGDHVILSWAPACSTCFYCLRDRSGLCETFLEPRRKGTMLDGTTRMRIHDERVHQFNTVSTFAERTVVPEQACIPVGKELSLKIAALVGCAVMTGVGATLYTVQIRPGDSVVVYGCGGVGLNVLQGAALHGAEPIIAIDQAPAKMELARTFGATHPLVADEGTTDAIRDLTGGRGADYVFEAIGIPAVQEAAFEALRPGGTLVLVGAAPVGSSISLPPLTITLHEKRVIGSLYGSSNPRRDFPMLLDLYAAGKLKLDELISREYRLDEINEAFEAMLGGEVARGLIVFD